MVSGGDLYARYFWVPHAQSIPKSLCSLVRNWHFHAHQWDFDRAARDLVKTSSCQHKLERKSSLFSEDPSYSLISAETALNKTMLGQASAWNRFWRDFLEVWGVRRQTSLKFASKGFHMEISTPRQLLRSLGPLLETSARMPPNFREVPPGASPVTRLAGRFSY